MNKRFTSLMTTLIFSVFFSISASAYDVEVDGIYYNLNKYNKTACVTYRELYKESYNGEIIIPSQITVDNTNYPVTYIDDNAFAASTNLTSVSIPNSVTFLGRFCFYSCSNLISVTIPNSVTSMGEYAFWNCPSLTSITLPDSMKEISNYAFYGCTNLTSIKIPDSIMEIGICAFKDCISLSSISIPYYVANIKFETFKNCKNLTSIYMHQVHTISKSAFEGCISLTSVDFSNILSTIDERAFADCPSLTSISIQGNVQAIYKKAFSGCINLEEIILGKSISRIDSAVFERCEKIENVFCYSEKVPFTKKDAFNNSHIENATLHIPSLSIEEYKSTEPWSSFGTIKAIEEETEPEKCATPSISFSEGQLRFSCETEGAKCYYTLNNSDVKTGETLTESKIVNLSACYDITCYAKAEGYVNSDVATAKLYWLPSSGTLEGDNINNVAMRGIAIQSAGGFINISGLDNNEKVSFYGIDGKALGSAKSIDGSVSFSAKQGSVVVAKIGKESVKIAVE